MHNLKKYYFVNNFENQLHFSTFLIRTLRFPELRKRYEEQLRFEETTLTRVHKAPIWDSIDEQRRSYQRPEKPPLIFKESDRAKNTSEDETRSEMRKSVESLENEVYNFLRKYRYTDDEK